MTGLIGEYIGIIVRVFANDPGDLGLILGRGVPKTLKMVLDAILTNTQQYKVRIKGKGVALSPTPWCSSYLGKGMNPIILPPAMGK